MIRFKIREKEEMGDDLCEYCPLENGGVYLRGDGNSIGCEGSRCDDAYDLYVELMHEQEEKFYRQRFDKLEIL